MSWQLGRWYLLALFIIVIDQLTKFWVTQMFAYGETFELLPILNMTLVHNTGAAFSFLSDAGGWQRWFFVIISMVVSTILAVWLYRLPSRQYLLAMAITLILGGALGNLCDRILLGYVVDFVDAHYQQHHWPAFNVADAAITLGAVLLILESLLAPKQRKMD
ncbi:MAG: signal peptidase II [Porticoccus sp.]|nr:signal peptidase II [Porticoccus sp.]